MRHSRVDAHHQVWDPTRHAYEWMNDTTEPVNRAFTEDDLRGELDYSRITRTMVVQAISSLEETRDLLATSARSDVISGVIGWVDLRCEDVDDRISELSEISGNLSGIRHQVNAGADPEWLLRPDVLRGLATLQDRGLTYDLLVGSQHRESCIRVAEQLPGLRFVLDHAGNPTNSVDPPWDAWFSRMGGLENVACKMSGLVGGTTEYALDEAVAASRRVIETFGPARTMFGSDWPICLLSTTYSNVWDVAIEATSRLSEEEQSEILGGTATRVYALGGEAS